MSLPLATLVFVLVLGASASVVGFMMIWLDKRAAERHRRRTPERALHIVELLGGWPGSLAAQRLFRHKTAKASYRLSFLLAAIAHVAAAGAVLVLSLKLGG